MSPYELWLSDTDDNGNLLDPQILKAARELGSTFFRYRQRELGCESLTNTIAQAAVEAASKANHGRPIENPKAYLLSVFTRKMNRFLHRQARNIALDDLSDANLNKTMKTSQDRPVERQLSIIELLDCMDEETRRISNLRFQGYSVTEIAKQLSISSNTLSARYRRGIARASANVKKRFYRRAA